jgi:hypothetical protein
MPFTKQNKPAVGTKVRLTIDNPAMDDYFANKGKVGVVVPLPEDMSERIGLAYLDVHFDDWEDRNGTVTPTTVLLIPGEFEVVG